MEIEYIKGYKIEFEYNGKSYAVKTYLAWDGEKFLDRATWSKYVTGVKEDSIQTNIDYYDDECGNFWSLCFEQDDYLFEVQFRNGEQDLTDACIKICVWPALFGEETIIDVICGDYVEVW